MPFSVEYLLKETEITEQNKCNIVFKKLCLLFHYHNAEIVFTDSFILSLCYGK